MARRETFAEILRRAVSDFKKNGFQSETQLKYWVQQLYEALQNEQISDNDVDNLLRRSFGNIYSRLVKGQIFKMHPTIPKWQVDRLSPQMRTALDQRILAAANLIKLNKQEMVERTLRRFQGWSTSIPVGGTTQPTRTPIEEIKKDADTKYIVRRCMNDQGHKLIASINEVVARGNEAIAVEWNSHWRSPGYNYREEHKERDQLIYAIKGNWALQQGLMKKGPNGYYDDITAFGEEINCRCYGTWIYSLTQLPADMLTEKGKAALAEDREKVLRGA